MLWEGAGSNLNGFQAVVQYRVPSNTSSGVGTYTPPLLTVAADTGPYAGFRAIRLEPYGRFRIFTA